MAIFINGQVIRCNLVCVVHSFFLNLSHLCFLLILKEEGNKKGQEKKAKFSFVTRVGVERTVFRQVRANWRLFILA